ncbi:MAG TPA: hypothetical protein VIK92_06225 [Thermaerobacter sp.]
MASTNPGRHRLAFVIVTGLLVAATVTWSAAAARALGGAGRVATSGRPIAGTPTAVAGAAAGHHRPGVTLVAVPGLDVTLLRVLASTDPTWRRLLNDAAVGLMVSHTGGYYGREAGYLTIGAGARAVSAPEAGWVVQADTRVGDMTGQDIFRGWTGVTGDVAAATPPPDEPEPEPAAGTATPQRAGTATAPAEVTAPAPPGGDRGQRFPAVLHLGWPHLLRINDELRHPVRPGALGDALRRAAIRTAALGNADLVGGPWSRDRRGAPLVTSDSRGRTDFGLIDHRTLRPDPTFPGGWRTDWARLLAAWRQLRDHAGLVVIEAGDLGRLEALAHSLEEGRLQQARLDAARALGEVMARLAAERRPGERLILVNPAPADGARAGGETLMPVAVWGAGHGLLASPSTRRAGVVLNTDLAPTIAAHLGAPPAPEWTGRPLAVVPAGGDPLAAIDGLNSALVGNYQRRAPFIRTYVLAGLILTGLPLLDLWRRRRRAWRLPLLALAAYPLAILLVPAWPEASPWISLPVSALLAVGLAAACHRLAPSTPAAFAGLGLATAAVTTADAFMGGWLAQLTPFGYSPIGGARFYGIGNEYAGVLIGATAVAAAGWADEARGDRGRRLILPLALSGASLVLAAPILGSNFGDALAGAIATVGPVLRVLVAARRRPAVAQKAVVTALAVPAAVVALVVAWDRLLGPASTHVWVSLGQIRQVGPPALVDLITRKLAMNLKLMRYTNWSYLFLMSVFAFAVLMYRRPALVRGLERAYPETIRGLTSIAAGAVAALALNDSGIVAAATTMVYGVSLLLALATDPPGGPLAPPGTPDGGTGRMRQ